MKPPEKIVALFLVRNEEWILRASITAARNWCDAIVVMDHNSIDQTPSIAKDMADVYIRKDGDTWHEMVFRQELLETGRSLDATHYALIDADEILTANLYESAREKLLSYGCGEVLMVPMIAPWRSPFKRRVDKGCVWPNAFISIGLAEDRYGPLASKMYWSDGTETYQHHQREPKLNRGLINWRPKTGGGCFHMQWAVWERLVAKHRWYKMMERLRYPQKPVDLINRQYSLALDEHGLELEYTPREWIDPAVFDRIDTQHTPWHIEAASEMIKKHGLETFSGLELWWEV